MVFLVPADRNIHGFAYTTQLTLMMRTSLWQRALVLLGSLALALYFTHHAAYGTHGLQARGVLLERSDDLERELALLRSVRSRLKVDVALLSQDPPQADIVEEVARDVLGLLYPSDRMLPR